MTKTILSGILSSAILLTAVPTIADAQQAKDSLPIRLVVGASPGGTTDTLARMLAEEMNKDSSRPVIVQNKPGAGGRLAAQEVERAAPDGSTLLVAFTSHTMNAALYKQLPYDPISDFTPITLLAKVTSVMVGNPNNPAKDLAEVIQNAKASGEPLRFAIGGVGSSLQMDTFDFAANTGIPVIQVPYKGSTPALADVMGGHVDFMFAPAGGVQPLLNDDKLKAYAVTGSKRIANLPDVPLVVESVPAFKTNYGWFGLFGPANMKPEVRDALNKAAVKALQSEKIKERLLLEGSAPEGNTPVEFAEFLDTDMKHWKAQVKAFGIQPQ